MSNGIFTLSYLNEEDKAYGLAGMAISLAALDALDMVTEVSIDKVGPMVTFSHQYYFYSSSSPKLTWDNLLHNYYITSAMVLSNLMARSLVKHRQEIPYDLLERVHSEIVKEGKESCSLEEDEIEALYSKTASRMNRIFRNPRLHTAIDEFSRTITRRRTLSANEIIDELRALSII